jgi:beta-galactosidase GanA
MRPTAEVPPGIAAVRRKTEAASFLFLLNHNEETVEVGLPNPGRELLTGKEHGSNLVLDPLGVAVLKESGSA